MSMYVRLSQNGFISSLLVGEALSPRGWLLRLWIKLILYRGLFSEEEAIGYFRPLGLH